MVYDSVYEANNYLRGTVRKQRFWEYFSGSKLQEATALLYSDNFTSNNFDYTNANGKFSYSSGKLNFDITSNSGTARAYKQLSSSLGSSDWELLYTVKFDSFTVGGNTTGLSIGVASNNTGTSNAYHTEYAFDGGARYNYLIANSQGNYSTTLFWNSGTEYFIRMKVTASTGKSDYVAYTSASDRSAGINPVANSTITKTPSTPPTTLMNYLVVKNERPTNGGSGDGYIKDITINRDTGTKWNVTNNNASTSGMSDEVDGGYYITDTNSYDSTVAMFNNTGRVFAPQSSVFIYQAKLSNAGAANASGGGLFNNDAGSEMVSHSGYQWEQSANVNYFMSSDGTTRSWLTQSGISAGYHTYSAESKSSGIDGSIDGIFVTTKTTNLPPTSGTGSKLQAGFWHKGASETFNINYFEAYNT